MAEKDLLNQIDCVEVFVPAAPGTTAVNGADVDLQGFNSCTFNLVAATAATGVYSVYESDAAGSGYTAAAADDVLGTQGSTITVGGGVDKIGYIGSKRYATLNVDLATDGVISVIGIRGDSRINKVD